MEGMGGKISVFLATDDNYAKFAATVFRSIRANTKRELLFFVLTKGLTADNRRKIAESAGGVEVRFLGIDAKQFESFKVDVHLGYITMETCFRYLIPELCPEIDKAVYIDCDTVCLDDIGKFYDIDISGLYAAVVRERRNRDYFNAGVMLLNCAKLRADNMSEKFMQKTRELNGVSQYLDQDVLNILLKGKVKFASPRWNMTPFIFSKRGGLHSGELAEILDNPGIVHMCGSDKPWTNPRGLNASPFAPLFFAYLKDTPFGGCADALENVPVFANGVKMALRNPLFFLKRQFYLRLKYYRKNRAKVERILKK